jgi:hypothetical protein
MTLLPYVVPFGFGAGALLDLDATFSFVILHVVCTSFMLAFEFLPAASRLQKISILDITDRVGNQSRELTIRKAYLLDDLDRLEGNICDSAARVHSAMKQRKSIMEGQYSLSSSSSRGDYEYKQRLRTSLRALWYYYRRQKVEQKIKFLDNFIVYQYKIKDYKRAVKTFVENVASEQLRRPSRDCKGLKNVRYQLYRPKRQICVLGNTTHVFSPSSETVVDGSLFSRHSSRYVESLSSEYCRYIRREETTNINNA